ncbi:MAG: arsenate reductase ArsC [Thermoguttaceae bacterium]
MLKVLFICSGNSCRSQMAEALARKAYSRRIAAYSAGIAAHGLDPDAVRVMAEVGIDISGQRSKCVEEYRDMPFDIVVTLSERAKAECPAFLNAARHVHYRLESPLRSPKPFRTESERLAPFRRARAQTADMIDAISTLFRQRAADVSGRAFASLAGPPDSSTCRDDCRVP